MSLPHFERAGKLPPIRMRIRIRIRIGTRIRQYTPNDLCLAPIMGIISAVLCQLNINLNL